MPRRKNSACSHRQTQFTGCIQSAARAAQARTEGDLKPDLAYTGQQAAPGPEGWVESEATVRSKQKSKEEFPRG